MTDIIKQASKELSDYSEMHHIKEDMDVAKLLKQLVKIDKEYDKFYKMMPSKQSAGERMAMDKFQSAKSELYLAVAARKRMK